MDNGVPVNARVPQVQCPEHGVHLVLVTRPLGSGKLGVHAALRGFSHGHSARDVPTDG